MKVWNLLYLLLVLAAALAPAFSARNSISDFLNLRRKYHRHHCLHRRCMPLHSRVPFP
uniref:Apelin receptor early endogenous ligand n=1 Tax=Oryzias melastigma TaxID=30732 RepID=A0A3B3CZ47_ORYME